MEEDKAIDLIKRGDLNGLESLVRRHQVQAVQTAYLIVGDRQSAEDIVQAAFLKAAMRIDQFEDGRPFGAWFLRIVRNDAIKASSREIRKLSLDAAQGMEVPPEWLIDPDSTPEGVVDTSERRRAVWEALRKLTPRQRDAVVMRYYLDMKDREIARETERSLPSVKWSIHAAKERLRKLLGAFPGITGSTEAGERRERGEDR